MPGQEDDKLLEKLEAEIAEPSFSIVSGKELFKKPIKEFPFVVDKLIPENAITTITAGTGRGKSLFVLIVAYHIVRGEPLFGEFKVKKGRVLIIDQELNEGLVVERYKSFFSGSEEIDFLYEQFWNIDNPADFDWLKEMIVKNKYNVVIFDSFSEIHGKDENSAPAMKIINLLMIKLIRETGITIISTHHHRKLLRNERYFSQNSSRGSTVIIDKVESQLVLDSIHLIGSSDKYITSFTIEQKKERRPQCISRITFDVVWDNQKTSWVYKGEDNVVKDDKVSEAKKIIPEILKDKKLCTALELESLTDIGRNNIRKALKELQKPDDKIDFKHGEGRQHNTKFYFLKRKDVKRDAPKPVG